VIKIKKVKSNPKPRREISNPFHKHSHDELLLLAGINDISNSYKIEELRNGKIKMVPKSSEKKS
jgi:hypothetical protein